MQALHRSLFACLLACSLSLSAISQPNIEWQTSFGSTSWDRAEDILPLNDGGFLVCGYAATNDADAASAHPGGDLWLIRLDTQGQPLWQQFLGGSGNDGGYAVRAAHGGGYIIAGASGAADGDVAANNGDLDAWVVKVDTSGNIEWEKNYGGAAAEWAEDIQLTSDGGYIVTGLSNSSDGDVSRNQGMQDVWIFKIAGDGNLQWEKTFGGSARESSRSVTIAPDGGFLVAGFTESTDGDLDRPDDMADYWLIRLDAQGDLLWHKTYGGSNSDDAYQVRVHPDSGFVVLGTASSFDGDVVSAEDEFTNGDFWLVRLSDTGDIIWEHAFGGTNLERGHSFELTTDGGYLLTGFAYSSDGDVTGIKGENDIWLMKVDADGYMEWQKTIGSTGEDEGIAIAQTADGGFIVAGANWAADGDADSNQGFSDMWVIKFESLTTAARRYDTPDQLRVYPNPGRGAFQLQSDEMIDFNVEVFNVYGQLLYRRQTDETLDLQFLPTGTYWLRVKQGGRSGSMKQIVIQR